MYPLNVERHRCVLYSFSVASALPSCSCLLNVEYCPIPTIQLHNTVTLFRIHSSILKAKKKHQCKNYHQFISLNQVAIELSAQLTVLLGLTCDESASKLIQVVCWIHLLVVVGLRALILCFLSARGHPQVLDTTHSFLTQRQTNMTTFFTELTKKASSSI